MFTLAEGDELEAVAEDTSVVTLTVFGKELTTDPGTGIITEVLGLLYQDQLPDSTTVIYTVPADTTTFITEMVAVNIDVADKFFAVYTNGTGDDNRLTPDLNVAPGGMALYSENGWQAYDQDGKLRTTTS